MRCCEQQAEVRASFVVGIPSDRSVCIKQVLIEGEAVGGFTPAGKPPPQLLCRSGIRSYGLVCCAQVIGATADVVLRRGTKALLVGTQTNYLWLPHWTMRRMDVFDVHICKRRVPFQDLSRSF